MSNTPQARAHRRRRTAIWSALLLCGLTACPAGKPADGPECSTIDNIPCPPGKFCVDFVCLAVCDTSADCGPAEACLEATCKPYAQACTEHGDCVVDWYCTNHACAKKLPPGSPCGTMAVACATGFCVDGVCCDAACTGGCETCVVGSDVGDGDDGHCVSVPAGDDPREFCDGPTACDGLGACFDKAQGEACENGYECPTGACEDGVCCNGRCDGVCETCASGTCEPISEAADPADECPGEAKCTGARSCYDGMLGDACGTAAEGYRCQSGMCVDGVCCDAPCDGVCLSCADLTAPGICAAVLDTSDVGTCDAGGAGSCGTAICTCDATGVCRGGVGQTCTEDIGCASGVCRGGVCCDGACGVTCWSCNPDQTGAAVGLCAPIPGGNDPLDQCNGTQATACNGAGGCYAVADGQPCSFAFECGSGYCVQGVCCSAACTQNCYSCGGVDTVVAQAGVCSIVLDGKDPDNECAGGAACDVGGACYARAFGADCTYGYQCAGGDCCGGKCTRGWEKMTVPTTVNLYGVSGTATDDVCVVGAAGTMLSWAGTTWSVVDHGLTTANLRAVQGTSRSAAVAVGDLGTAIAVSGATGALLDTKTASRLYDVWVQAGTPTKITAVGQGGTITVSSGTTFALATSGTATDLFDYWEGGAGTFAVGGRTTFSPITDYSAARERFSIGGWRQLTGWSAPGRLSSIVGFGADTLYLSRGQTGVGEFVDRRIGTIWTYSVYSPAAPILHFAATGTVLFGVSGTSIVQFDGSTWSTSSTASTRTLNNIWAADECHVFAVGDGGTIIRR